MTMVKKTTNPERIIESFFIKSWAAKKESDLTGIAVFGKIGGNRRVGQNGFDASVRNDIRFVEHRGLSLTD